MVVKPINDGSLRIFEEYMEKTVAKLLTMPTKTVFTVLDCRCKRLLLTTVEHSLHPFMMIPEVTQIRLAKGCILT
jgi:hypothetical protein